MKESSESAPEGMERVLAKLQSYLTNGYLLHGGKEKVSLLEPRQARDNNERKTIGNQKAIYAIDSIRVPIIKALLAPGDPSIRDWSSRYSDYGDRIEVGGRNFSFTPGYVYVLPRDSFIEIEDENGHKEIVSYEPVVPTDIVRITPDILNYMSNVSVLKNSHR